MPPWPIWGGGIHLLNPNPSPPKRSAGSLGSKLEAGGLGQGGFLRGSSTSGGAPEWQPKCRIGPGDPKNTPRRGGGCPVRAPGAAPWPRVQGESRVGHPQRVLWGGPQCPPPPQELSGGSRIFIDFYRGGYCSAGGGGGGCFLLGFYLCFKGRVKKRKKRISQPSRGCGTWDSAAGGGQAGPPQTPIACE